MKKYLKADVYEAFCHRLNFIFNEFEQVYLSVSAGKDSSVMLQLAHKIADQKALTFDVLFMDLEGQYEATIKHMEELKKLSTIRDMYHVCLPFNFANANSIFEHEWLCWDTKEKSKWIREMPKDAINVDNQKFGKYYKYGMEYNQFKETFPRWLMKKHNTKKIACVVGIRADESYNRFRAIAFGKHLYKKKTWTTDNGNGYVSCYPIFDWSTQDIWHAVSKFKLKYNSIYDCMYKNGVTIHDQRICQPYGNVQRVSLDQWAVLEPNIWPKLLARVSGVNFGSTYAGTTLVGYKGTQKPKDMSWEHYAVFLLECMRLYKPLLMKYYAKRIKRFIVAYKARERASEVPWKMVARCVETNDYSCRSLSYATAKVEAKKSKRIKNNVKGLFAIS